MPYEVALWVGFGVVVTAMLALDLGVFHRKSEVISIRHAFLWSGIWIALALAFNVGVYFMRGGEAAVLFLTGYVVELSLSVDNLFVFLLIFSYFKVPAQYQHRVLYWGIVGAVVLRALLIALGIGIVTRFDFVLYLFGAFLIFTGIKMAVEKEKEVHPEKNVFLRLLRRFMPITSNYEDKKFFVRRDGRLWATPLLVVLVVVETTDLVFAVDSIPAILGITRDSFIVYTSNVFAILGLRSMYFALAHSIQMFAYLNYGLAAVLTFVGAKMLLHHFIKIPSSVSLGVVLGLLTLAILASLWRNWRVRTSAITPPVAADDPGQAPVSQEKKWAEVHRGDP